MVTLIDQQVLEVIRDAEVTFPSTYISTPARTIRVPTDAPVLSQTVEVHSAADTFTFPGGGVFNDRFLVWRTVGQKLFIEERSLKNTMSNSLCFHFTRSSILPGTSFSVFCDALVLVVPTQSSIHRFVAHLPKSTQSYDETHSVFALFGDESCLGQFHESHLIVSQGHPTRASIAQGPNATKAVYLTMEGYLVHIHMPIDNACDVEETLLKDAGIIRRILGAGSSDSESALDVCALPGNAERCDPLFFAVYRDLQVKVWNGETRKISHTLDLDRIIQLDVGQLRNVIVRACYSDRGMPCFLAGVDAGAQSAFLISQVNTLDIQQIACFTAHSSVQKCDLLDAKFWPKIGDAWHVTALWSDYSSARHTPYRLHHTVIGKARLSTLEDPGYSWRSVSICNSNAMYHTHDATLEKLQEMVYNTDLHNIEVVARAVQVVCQGKTFDARYDWKGLRRFVEMYAQTPEFDERFDRLEGKLTMYKMIVEKCAELEAAVNNPIRIFRIDSPLSSLWGIVRHGALTMVTEAPAPLLKIITRQGFGPSSRQLADLVEYTEIAAASAQEEEDMDDDCAKICETAKAPRDLGRLTTCVEALLKYMEEMAAEQKGNVEERSTFGGAFTDNLLSAILRRRIRAIQSTTHNLSHFFLLVKSKRWDTRQHERFNKLYNQANQLTKSYRLLNDQLTDRILGNDAYMSLCTWVIHFGLPLLCAPNSQFSQSPNMMEGSEDGSSSAAQIARPHDVFLQTAVEGLLSMLIPSNKRLSLLQMIAKAKDYALLKKMIDLVEAADSASSLSTSTPIGVTYFRAIAFSGSGRPDKALAAFEQCIPAALSGDPELAAVLFSPAETAVTSSLLSRFFLRAIELLSNHGHVSQVSCLALQASMHLKNGDGPRYALERIHIILFTQQVDGGEWGMALETIRACQNSDSQRGLLESMVFRLLSLRAWKLICSSIPWREFTNEVACLLFDKASAMSPKECPNIFELLASFYAARFDNYNAANSLYEWAQRLAELPQDPPMYAKRRDILAATSLYLSMNTENRRSYLHARSHKGDYHRKKTQTDEFVFGTGTISTKVSASMEDINEIYNSDELFQSRFVDAERVKREWSILDVRVLLCRELPQCIPPPNDPEALLMLLLELRRFDHARVFACIHGLPVDGVFQMITKAAIEYDCDEDPPTNWVLENPKFVSDRGTCDPWNIVKGHLEAHMQTKNSIVSPLCVVLNTMLEEGYPNVHPWLHKMFMKTDVGSYLVTLSNYTKNRQVLEAIIEYSGEMFKQVKGIDSNVVLPYCALDVVLKRAQEDRDREVMTFYTKAVDSVKSLQSRIQAFEAASKFTQKSQPDSRISFMS